MPPLNIAAFLPRTIGRFPNHQYTVYAHRAGYITLHSCGVGSFGWHQSSSKLLSTPVRVGARKGDGPRATFECDTTVTRSAISIGRPQMIGPGFCPRPAQQTLVLVGHMSTTTNGEVGKIPTVPQPRPPYRIGYPSEKPADVSNPKLIFEPVIPKLNHKPHLLPTPPFPRGTAKFMSGEICRLRFQAIYWVPDLSIIASQHIYAGLPLPSLA